MRRALALAALLAFGCEPAAEPSNRSGLTISDADRQNPVGTWADTVTGDRLTLKKGGELEFRAQGGEAETGRWSQGEPKWSLSLQWGGKTWQAQIDRPELIVNFPERGEDDAEAAFVLQAE